MGVITATPIEWRNASEDAEQKRVEPDAMQETSGFYSSVKAHKSIKVVFESIVTEAALSFDYIAMVIIAAGIAVGGLAINSQVLDTEAAIR